MDTKIAAFGESDIMLIFKAAGIEVFPVAAGMRDVAEIERKLEELIKANYGIIFMTETIALKLDSLIRRIADKLTPSIVVIPGLGKRNDYAVTRLRRAIIKAVGVDIMSENKESVSE